jgi:hypothetical protein
LVQHQKQYLVFLGFACHLSWRNDISPAFNLMPC